MGVYSNIIILLQAPKNKTSSSGFAKGRISHVEKLHIALSEPWYSISSNDYFFICSLGIEKPLGQQNKKMLLKSLKSSGSPDLYPLVIKHGNGTYIIQLIFPLKTPLL